MEAKVIQDLFNDFLRSYNEERTMAVWEKQSMQFRQFWKEKVVNAAYPELTPSDMDEIVLILDKNARGATEFRASGGDHIARTGITQGMWYRVFRSIKKEKRLQDILSRTFENHDPEKEISLISELEAINKPLRNGLTGLNANIINAILFAENPRDYLSIVSLRHRFMVIEAFGFGNPSTYASYGEKVVRSSEDILNGFKTRFSIDAAPRTISIFLYRVHSVKSYWQVSNGEPDGHVETESLERPVTESSSEFAIEKHLEDFLVANWESTELGQKYELIESEGDLLSQQYPTDIGPIDLLVKNKIDGTYAVIELKKGQTSDSTAGQLMRYMGWIKQHLAKGKPVKGIVIAAGMDDRLEYALRMVPNTEFLSYKITFELRPIVLTEALS